MRTQLFKFDGAVERNPAVEAWLRQQSGELGVLAAKWFRLIRTRGNEVRELIHDGGPVACLIDTPFAYVRIFSAHINIGFFQGASPPDPGRLQALAGLCAM